jgi:hypothetical protein
MGQEVTVRATELAWLLCLCGVLRVPVLALFVCGSSDGHFLVGAALRKGLVSGVFFEAGQGRRQRAWPWRRFDGAGSDGACYQSAWLAFVGVCFPVCACACSVCVSGNGHCLVATLQKGLVSGVVFFEAAGAAAEGAATVAA